MRETVVSIDRLETTGLDPAAVVEEAEEALERARREIDYDTRCELFGSICVMDSLAASTAERLCVDPCNDGAEQFCVDGQCFLVSTPVVQVWELLPPEGLIRFLEEHLASPIVYGRSNKFIQQLELLEEFLCRVAPEMPCDARGNQAHTLLEMAWGLLPASA